MPTVEERNAAVDAVRSLLPQIVPAMFIGYIHTDVILRLCDAALKAAEKARSEAQMSH